MCSLYTLIPDASCPAAQTHWVEPPAKVVFPAAQATHELDPGVEAYVPRGHALHASLEESDL